MGSGLSGALFTPVQRRVLGLLFGQPEQTFAGADVIRAAKSGTGAVHRQLQRLESAGVISSQRLGTQKRYQANSASPIFHELHGIVTKTFGVVEPLRAALAPIAARIDLAFVFGSVAKGTDTARSDLDLLVVSDDLSYPEVHEALLPTERWLARSINPKLMKRAEWRTKKSGRDSFARRIAEQPKLFVIGNENGLD